ECVSRPFLLGGTLFRNRDQRATVRVLRYTIRPIDISSRIPPITFNSNRNNDSYSDGGTRAGDMLRTETATPAPAGTRGPNYHVAANMQMRGTNIVRMLMSIRICHACLSVSPDLARTRRSVQRHAWINRTKEGVFHRTCSSEKRGDKDPSNAM